MFIAIHAAVQKHVGTWIPRHQISPVTKQRILICTNFNLQKYESFLSRKPFFRDIYEIRDSLKRYSNKLANEALESNSSPGKSVAGLMISMLPGVWVEHADPVIGSFNVVCADPRMDQAKLNETVRQFHVHRMLHGRHQR